MLFRSEKVSYHEVMIPYESAWHVMNSLGSISSLQFIDCNALDISNKLPYTEYIKRCTEMATKILDFDKIFGEFKVNYKKCLDVEDYMKDLSDENEITKAQGDIYFNELETFVNNKHNSLVNNKMTLEKIIKIIEDYREEVSVLKTVRPHIPQNFNLYSDALENERGAVSSVRFNYICGTLSSEKVLKFERTIYRITRGKAFVKSMPLDIEEDPEKQQENAAQKSLFFIAVQMSGTNVVVNKVIGICESYECKMYSLPKNHEDFSSKLETLHQEIESNLKVRAETRDHIRALLVDLACVNAKSGFSTFEMTRLKLFREQNIYETLNRLILRDNVFYGRVWIPAEFEGKVKQTLTALSNQVGVSATELRYRNYKEVNLMPPTYFKTNVFTGPFQDIVETYGVPRYREVNPGLFTIVTFPYQFGVMFGDIGHGGLLLACAIALVFNYKSLRGTSLEALGDIRFLLLLMGIFAFYNGLTYNDFFGIPLKLFGTCYDAEFEREKDCTVSLGVDSVWYMAKNEIPYLNSFKMKLSIIIGVLHMMMGISMRAFNNVHFNQWVDLFFEFVPQIVFMAVTFGYMCVVIIMKWLINWEGNPHPPSILNIYTGMGITTSENVLWGDAEGLQQTALQQNLFIIAGICVPLMLLPKPIINHFKAAKKHGPAHHEGEATEKLLDDHEHPKPVTKNQDPFNCEVAGVKYYDDHGDGFGEAFIHQMIEVIEFVLGSVSNTASYLRLWALSLAHSQLAKVFLDMTIMGGIKSHSFLSVFIMYPVFVGCTIGVLMCMDLMECFLHALRLHWVEFQNKFFKGDGHKFEPLSFWRYVNNQIKVLEGGSVD